MKTRSYLSLFTMAVILMTLLLLAACQPDTAPKATTNNADAALGGYGRILHCFVRQPDGLRRIG